MIFTDGLDEGCERMGVMEDSRDLGWSNWKKGIASYCDGGEEVWGKLEKPI